MKSHTTERFRSALAGLPEHVQRQAREAYRRFTHDPFHPSLRFRQVHPTRPIYSARISRDYRALGVREGEEITWFWIGSHADYDNLIAQQERCDQAAADSGEGVANLRPAVCQRALDHRSERVQESVFHCVTCLVGGLQRCRVRAADEGVARAAAGHVPRLGHHGRRSQGLRLRQQRPG